MPPEIVGSNICNPSPITISLMEIVRQDQSKMLARGNKEGFPDGILADGVLSDRRLLVLPQPRSRLYLSIESRSILAQPLRTDDNAGCLEEGSISSRG